MKTTQQQLLKFLANGQCYSGETLGQKLQISRAGIWKAIKQLKQLGVNIQSLRGNGYQIPNGLDLLNQEEILMNLEPSCRQQLDDLIILEAVDSTNNYLLKYNIPLNKKVACFAEYQTQGRGRRGRQWLSPLGHNIYCSLLWHFNCDAAEMIGLSLAIAVAVLRSLQDFGIHQHISLKWPNDILYSGKKLAGILIDLRAESHDHCSVVVGVGINTYLTSEQMNLVDQVCISLQQITQHPIKRNHLASLLLKHLLIVLEQFPKTGLAPFLDEWQQFDAFKNKMVVLTHGNRQITGKVLGITEHGELILIDAQQNKQTFFCGEVSLRPNIPI